MKRFLLPILSVLVLALACGGAAWADTIEDPLHGQCNGTAPTGTCSDNGTNTPLGNSTTFGFTISPAPTPQTGTLLIDILVPNNYVVGSSFTISSATSSMTWTATEKPGTWSGGTLASFLGFVPTPGASPNNPIGAYLPFTQTLDPTATGFFVFQANVGTQTVLPNSGASTAADSFKLPAGFGNDVGGYIVGFFSYGPGTPYVATANSGALVVTPEPGSLLMLGAGLLGLALLAGRRVLAA